MPGRFDAVRLLPRTADQAGWSLLIGSRLALLAIGLLAAMPASAITYVLPTDESLVDRTPTILFGRVLSATPAPGDLRLPATDFTFQVEEVLKGAVADSTVTVRQLGGRRPDGMAMQVSGLPRLREGERVLLFLAEREGVHATVDFGLGIFFETRLQDRSLLERAPSLREEVLDVVADGDAAALLGPRDGALFRRWIRDRAAGLPRPADYFVPESEVLRGPAVVTSPYRFSRTRSDCVYPDHTIRWTEFEQGGFVAFRLQEGGQPGLSEAVTRRAVNNAMQAWNSDAGSRVDLRYHADAVSPERSALRGWNLMMFDDPFETRYPLIPGEGGALAWARRWYSCNSPPVRRPPPYDRYSDVRITQSDIVTAKGLGTWLQWRDSSAVLANLEEILAHELGHSLGFAHPCGDDVSGECKTTATDEAIMRGRIHLDARGARLSSDDRAILRQLYPEPVSEPPLQAPTDVSVVPTSSTTVRVSWRDRSDDEDGFQVWKRLEGAEGAGWSVAARTPASIEQAHVSGLRPGGKYRFLVRALHADGHADSETVVVTMPPSEPPLQAPTDVSVVPTESTTVRVSWRDRSDNEDGFEVWKRLEGAGWSAAVRAPANIEQAHVSGLRPGGRYRFFVRAFHADGHADSETVAVTMPRPDPVTPPRAPTDVSAVPTNGTTVRVSWRDRSDNEDGFEVWNRLGGAGWSVAARTAADIEEALVSDLRPGGRYRFLVRAFHADGHANSDHVVVTMREPGTLHGSRFGVGFSAEANGSEVTGQEAGWSSDWSSDKGVLYWLFDPRNPEALVKVLDGRSWNGHWWFDLAVASDLRSVTKVFHHRTGDEWVVLTGFGKDVFLEPGESANRLVHCAYPLRRDYPEPDDNTCAVSGYGTTVSLRDAWGSSGRIPSSYFPSAFASADAASVDAGHVSADPGHRRFARAANRQGTAGLPGHVPQAAVDHAPVRRLRQRHRVEPALPLPARTGHDGHANGLPVPAPTAAAEPVSLQRSQFDISFSANANDSTAIGESGWSSDKGVLYWLFDPQNPEALVKVLDGRSWNGHWWFDLAVASDLRSVTRVIHVETGDEWVAITGFGKDVFREPGEAANRLVHCAFPASRADGGCAVSGYGTTVSLRDAWNSSGRIPSRYYD